jgi:hypothetical protein
MDLVNGTFTMVSHSGLPALLAASGIPEDVCKLAMDPSNVVTATTSFENGVFTFKEDNSKVPMFCFSTTSKLGEESEFTVAGIKSTYTLTKKADDCFIVKSESKEQGKGTYEYTFNNFGFTCEGSLSKDGNCLSFNAIYERCKPCVDGYYLFEKEEGTDAYMKKVYPDIDLALVKKSMKFASMRVSTCGDMMTMDEYFGDSIPAKTVTYKLDEEFRYQLEAFGMDLNMVMTCTGPGMFTCVSKNNKTGSIQDLSWAFTKKGTKFCSKDISSGLTMTHYLKRSPDMLGTFKLVTHTSMTAYFDALEIPAAARTHLIPPAGMRVTTTRCGDDMFSVKSTSDMIPDVTFRLGEEYTYSVPIPGGAPLTAKSMVTMTETGDIQVSKVGDKVIIMKSDITGDFIISTVEVEGKSCSRVKMIFIRC